MTQEEQILSQLNPEQQAAVSHIDGPVMVIAGAGSGKTRVLTYRIAYMLAKGISPYQILALTFTNKAAGEMKERIFKLLGNSQAKAVSVGTFHSVFLRILRIEADKLGFTRNMTIYDTDDSKSLIKKIVKELNLDPKAYKEKDVLSRISQAKSNLISAREYAANQDIVSADARNHRPHLAEIFVRYQNRLKKSDAMDFDDILFYMNVLLRDFPEMLFKYQNRFRYVLVDEYQDTNFSQYLIIKKLSAAHHNICVVGDDAQSIYAFRGANIQNILNFKNDYPDATVVKLEQNYRSTQNIVNAANALIKFNRDQLPKEVWTDNDAGRKIDIVQLSDEREEAAFIADRILELQMNLHIDNSKFSLLYRTNSQSRALEEALIKRRIPYKIYAGHSFYNKKEIKDLLAYCRLAVNHYDDEAIYRIINTPARGIGETTMEKVTVLANENQVRIWDIVEDPETYIEKEINGPTKTRLFDFANKIKSYTAMLQNHNAYDLGVHIAKTSGLLADLQNNPEEKERVDNMEELLDAMKAFTENPPEESFNETTGEVIENYMPTLDRYLESVVLLTDSDEKEEDKNSNKVKLMTIHSAKGLEFDHVFITGMEENLFPSALSIGSRRELEEERRLFYVAVTRAKETLTMTHACTRYRMGELRFCEPSRFLDEIPVPYINRLEKASAGRGALSLHSHDEADNFSAPRRPQSNFVPKRIASPTPARKRPGIDISALGKLATPTDIVPELRIYHQKFGYGVVVTTEGDIRDRKAVIHFDSVGEKTLLLNFAQLIIPKK